MTSKKIREGTPTVAQLHLGRRAFGRRSAAMPLVAWRGVGGTSEPQGGFKQGCHFWARAVAFDFGRWCLVGNGGMGIGDDYWGLYRGDHRDPSPIPY